MFENLDWRSDRLLLDGLVFRLEHYKNDQWDLGSECFSFYKIKELIDAYDGFLSSRKGFAPANVLELGIWDGGSAAFWFETLRPKRLVALDISTRGDSDYFRHYVASRNLGDRIKTYWGTNQADTGRLHEIVAKEFDGPLDLVLDDASHIYEPTKISFECLFPLLRPGGLYIIEDWAWGHWKEYWVPDHPFAQANEPTRLVCELIEAAGTPPHIVASVFVCGNFVAIERGNYTNEQAGGGQPNELGAFTLERFISRRPPRSALLRLLKRLVR